MIVRQGKVNAPFRVRRDTFLELCSAAINPPDDVDEMLIEKPRNLFPCFSASITFRS